ncbi:alveolar macrophage chemotactic factor-like [Dermochelys coriacea]|uniref:alveolar macrophage chemotactic factor-like n=1 Tax=Dermochelys coriacea TaxID=27794 RepID=UPI001CA92C24|nr:alveolar macrophage chemotactic factor-like [Dermochelys coriacea]
MVYKLIVALAVVALTSSHELTMNGGRCLCLRTTDKMVFRPNQLKTIEILPQSASCENVEIIVNLKSGRQICLDPNANQIKNIFQQLIKKKGKKNDKPRN